MDAGGAGGRARRLARTARARCGTRARAVALRTRPPRAKASSASCSSPSTRCARTTSAATEPRRAETPALDALAAEGVRFETAISPAPLTLPSHATLLTGRDPPQHGVRHNGLFRLPRGRRAARGAPARRPASRRPASSRRSSSTAASASSAASTTMTTSSACSSAASGRPRAERRGDQTVDAALAWLDAGARALLPLGAPLRPARALQARRRRSPRASPDGPTTAEIAFADAQVGRLRAALAERWPQRNALVADLGPRREPGRARRADALVPRLRRHAAHAPARGRAGRAARARS